MTLDMASKWLIGKDGKWAEELEDMENCLGEVE